MHRWELRGVGHADARLTGEAVVHESEGVTVVTGYWNQEQLVELTGLLMTPEFELVSIRRLDAHP